MTTDKDLYMPECEQLASNFLIGPCWNEEQYRKLLKELAEHIYRCADEWMQAKSEEREFDS